MITVPTTITEDQYKAANFAINTENAEFWLMLEDQCIFLGVDQGTLKETIEDMNNHPMERHINAEKTIVTVVGTSGEAVEIEALVFSTSNAYGQIDLEELAEGNISWV